MSERGVMQVNERGRWVELIPFVGIKPKGMALALTQKLGRQVRYVKHAPSSGGGTAPA